MNGLVVLAIYALLMIIATLLFTKKEKTIEGFHVGNRKIGMLPAALSIAATWIWAPSLFVSAERAYSNGFIGLFWFLAPNVACLLIFIPFAKKIRAEMPQGITLSGYMSEKYKTKKVKGAYLFQLTGLNICSTAVQLLAGAKILNIMTGLSFLASTIMLAVIALAYSIFSGIKASVLTDVIQMFIILAFGIGFVFFSLSHDFTVIGSGFGALVNGLTGINNDFSTFFSENSFNLFLSFGLPTAIGLLSGPFGDQCFWQRAFSIKKDKIGKAFTLGAVVFASVPLLMAILGFIASGSGFIPQDTSIVNFEFIMSIFPAWVALPFLFMIVSGLLSTVDSNLCAISSLTSDITKSKKLKLPRLSMILSLILGIAIANISGLTVTHLFLFYGTLRATTLLPTIFTLKGIKLSSNGVFIGIVVALSLGLPIFAYGSLMNIPLYKTIGSLTAVLTSGAVALIATRFGGKCK